MTKTTKTTVQGVRMLDAERARLRALAAVTGRPIYKIVADAIDAHLAALPADVREHVERAAELSERKPNA